MAFDKIVTHQGNFAEVTRKAVNAANQIRSRMFGKINPQDRIDIIREHAVLLTEYADCLEQIWDTEKRIQEGTLEAKGYIKLDKKESKDENISEPEGDVEGSGKGSVRDGDSVSDIDGPGLDSI